MNPLLDRADYATSATVPLAPATYNVGTCVRNTGGATLSNNQHVTVRVRVTS
jgi:hypothetical protein